MSLSDALGPSLVLESLLHLGLLLVLLCLEQLHVCLEFDVGGLEDFVEAGPLLLFFDFSVEFEADFHGGRVAEARRHLARLRVLLHDELVDRLLGQEVEADEHGAGVWRRDTAHHREVHVAVGRGRVHGRRLGLAHVR